MNHQRYFFVFIFLVLFTGGFWSHIYTKSSQSDFFWIYSKFFTENDFKNLKQLSKKEYIWQQESSKPFRELILSWNAFRPKKGRFSFFVSVKHNYWSHWYKIAEWGAESQQTFVNAKNPFVHVKHVKVEVKKGRKASVFRIKVKAEKGADLKNVKSLFVCLSKGNGSFKIEKPDTNLPGVWVKGVPRQSQMVLKHPRFLDFCSPASISMVVNYFLRDKKICKGFVGGLKEYVPKFAQKVHDNCYLDIYGNWILNVAQAFDSAKGKAFFRVERLNGFSHLYSYLKKNVPVAVSVRGRLNGGATTYENGHFVVVIGWHKDSKSLICLDPAFKESKNIVRAYNIHNFLKHWGNAASPNLAYVPLPKNIIGNTS